MNSDGNHPISDFEGAPSVQVPVDAVGKAPSRDANRLSEADRYDDQGTQHYSRGEFQQAVDCYEAAIALHPDRIIARYQYLVGLQEEREGDFVAAFARFQAAIDAEPDFVHAYRSLGDLLLKVGDAGGAATCFRDAEAIEQRAASSPASDST